MVTKTYYNKSKKKDVQSPPQSVSRHHHWQLAGKNLLSYRKGEEISCISIVDHWPLSVSFCERATMQCVKGRDLHPYLFFNITLLLWEMSSPFLDVGLDCLG